MNGKKTKAATIGRAVLLSLVILPQVHATTINIGFEAAEGYTAGALPLNPWLCRGGNGATSDYVRVSSTSIHNGTQSLAITPVELPSYDHAIYPVMVAPGASASFSVWIRTGSHIANYEGLGYIGVRELDTFSEYWNREVSVSFENALGSNGEGGTTQFSLTCGALNNRIGDFSPLSWYRVDCNITPTAIKFIVAIDTGTVTNTIPRYANYRVDRILLGGANLSATYFDDFSYTPPVLPVTLTIQSTYGTPVPAVGDHSYFAGDVVTCQVSSVTQSLTNYSASSWTASGHTPGSGSGNQAILNLTDNTGLTWNWQTNYWFDVNVVGSGSVNVADGFYAKNSEPILVATPDSGWLFMGWSGDASGTNNAVVAMHAPQAVMATFSDDADGDGLLNSNEVAIGSNPWKSDTDDDGFDDAFEVGKGLSPTHDDRDIVGYISNHDKVFGLYPSNAVLDVAIGQMLIETAGSNAVMSLQLRASDNLVTWTNAGDAVEWKWPIDDAKKFFRVRSAE